MSDNSDSDDEFLMNIAIFRTRRVKNVQERIDHFNKWNDDEFFSRFRLSKRAVQFLLEHIEEQLQSWTERYVSIFLYFVNFMLD